MQPNQEKCLAAQERAGQPAACAAAAFSPAADAAKGTASLSPAPKQAGIKLEYVDGIFALVTLVLGYLFLRWVSLIFAGAGIPLFTLCFLAVVLCYARRAGCRPARASWGWGGFLFAFSLLFLKGMPGSLVFPALVFLCALASYWTLVVFGVRISGRLDGNFAKDLFNALLRLPFCSFGALPRAVASLRRGDAAQGEEEKKRRRVVTPSVAAGTLLTALLLPLVLLLLAQADAGFERALTLLFGQIEISPEFLLRAFFSIPVSLYFFGLFCAARHQLHTGPDAAGQQAVREAKRSLGFAAAAIPTAALLAVYLLFFVSQLPYFFSAFAGLLPEGFTYAEYARRGFFELLAVAAINLGLLLFAKRRTPAASRGRRLLSGLLCGATLLLLITAARKLTLYIDIFGLTRLRIWAGWAMVFVAAATLLFLLDEFRPLELLRLLVLLFCGWFFLLCAVNTESITLRYNYDAWQSGQIEEFDPWQGDDFFAAPALCGILADAEEDWIREACTLRVEQAVQEFTWREKRPLTGFTLQGMFTLRAADRVAAEGLLYWGAAESAELLE